MSKGSAEENLKSKYATLFDASPGMAKGITAKLRVKGAVPNFFKPRPVPSALKDKIADELEMLERVGVIEKVNYSNWSAPIVPIQKPDGSVRISGDHKITTNPALEVQQCPLPTAQELFANLRGGQKFSKLDLSTAYQQVESEEASRKNVCINTHKGLYRYTRLPYGVACAPALFQQAMDRSSKVYQWDASLITSSSLERQKKNMTET